MKNIKMYEHFNHIEKVVYWLVPSDNRLADSIVKIISQYGDKENMIEVIDSALDITKEIEKLKLKDNFVYITLSFYVDENDEVVGSTRFGWFVKSFRDIMDRKQKHYYVGTYNIEEHELDADKYNL